MNPQAEQWVRKAEGDWHTASREIKARSQPNYDGICFHLQQCIEKYMKALLVEAGRTVRRIHDLPALAEEIKPLAPEIDTLTEDLVRLNQYAVAIRYPGVEATREESRTAAMGARRLRLLLRKRLGVTESPKQRRKRGKNLFG